MSVKNIEFPKKNYLLERELGHGACGRTVLLFDKAIDERFACKNMTQAILSTKKNYFLTLCVKLKFFINLIIPI